MAGDRVSTQRGRGPLAVAQGRYRSQIRCFPRYGSDNPKFNPNSNVDPNTDHNQRPYRPPHPEQIKDLAEGVRHMRPNSRKLIDQLNKTGWEAQRTLTLTLTLKA